jgi:hypothetical protein
MPHRRFLLDSLAYPLSSNIRDVARMDYGRYGRINSIGAILFFFGWLSFFCSSLFLLGPVLSRFKVMNKVLECRVSACLLCQSGLD